MLAAATIVLVAEPGGRGQGLRSAPGGLVVGGGRRGRHSVCARALRPRRWEEEGAVVGVLVQVGVGPPGLSRLGGRVRVGASGHLC